MLFNRSSQIKQLVTMPLYFTAKSKRQTTPNLFQNPKLTPHGIIQRIPKSYDYNIPQGLPNKHLYWHRTIQNKAKRTQYNKKKLQRLQIKPIHVNGQRTFERSLPEILQELSRIRLIRASPKRTMVNLSEVLLRFKEELNSQDRQIILNAMHEIHERFIPSLSLYHFSSYIQLRCLLSLPCTQKIFIHFYKFIQKFSEMSNSQVLGEQPVKKFKLSIFLKIFKYVFHSKNTHYLENNKHLMEKSRQMFKLFEDNDPRYITLQELLPNVYSRQEVQEQLQNPKVKQDLKYVVTVPGGKQLYKNLLH